MPAFVTAAARTPWSPRHGALAAARPEVMLQAALNGLLERRGIEPHDIDRVLVACDTSVGAQDLNLGRRTILGMGWYSVPALTVDGQGIGDLALMGMATALPGRTVVAAVDSSSMVPPGAGQVRDYGRPTLDEPDLHWLEQVATEARLSAGELDLVATGLRAGDTAVSEAIEAISVGTRMVGTDELDLRAGDDLSPLVAEGVQTAWHMAELADGGAAVLIEGEAVGGRRIVGHSQRGVEPGALITELSTELREATGSTLLATSSAVIAATVGAESCSQVASVLAIGSTPSANGLRMVADAFYRKEDAHKIVTVGRHGQMATVSVGERD